MTSNDVPTDQTFFLRDGDRFVPTIYTHSAWDPNGMRGGAVSGLLMHAIEDRHVDDAFQVTRFTVDMFRMAPKIPSTVRTTVVREGNRIRVVDATLIADGLEVARASVVMLRRTDPPEGTSWSPPTWDVPHPDTIAALSGGDGRLAIWEQRNIAGQIGRDAMQKRAWLRTCTAFVDDAPASDLVRAAIVSDYANPLSNYGDRGLNYVNADITLYMHRVPAGEWIGVEVASHHAEQGIAVGECALYDLDGAFGRTTVSSIGNRRRT